MAGTSWKILHPVGLQLFSKSFTPIHLGVISSHFKLYFFHIGSKKPPSENIFFIIFVFCRGWGENGGWVNTIINRGGCFTASFFWWNMEEWDVLGVDDPPKTKESHEKQAGWWFHYVSFFYFHPENWGFMIQFDEHIFGCLSFRYCTGIWMLNQE